MQKAKLETIKCSNFSCKHREVITDSLETYINKLCPQCGEILFTDIDYKNVIKLETLFTEAISAEPENVEPLNTMLQMIQEDEFLEDVFNQIGSKIVQ